MVARAGPLDHAAHRAGGAEPHRRVLSTAPLRVTLDLGVRRLDRAGVSRYATSLLGALRERTDVEPIALGDAPYVERGIARRAAVLRQDLLWHPWLARREARRRAANVHHAPSPRAPLVGGRPPVVVTLHDLNFVVRPSTASTWGGRYGRATIRRVLRAADRVIAVSQATADDADHLMGVGGDRLRVVHSGVDARWFAPTAPDAERDADAPYVLCVGTLEPRKNLPRAVAAMRLRRARGAAERLLVVGATGWGDVRLEEDDLVRPLGRVGDDALHTLYAGARCLLLPSLHEGFGLPALEAMAAGCPVVAARAGALPEVCGDAAVLVDPLDARDIARGVDEAIARADDLRDLGRARAGTLSWGACAERTLRVYREVA